MAGTVGRGLQRAVAAVAVVLVVTAATGAPAAADRARTPTVDVRPATNLVDDQRVRVIGDGWRPWTFLIIAQCDARATSFKGCDGSHVLLLLSSGDDWAAPFRVDRGIDTEEFGPVDCAAAAGSCVIGVLARPGRVLAEGALHFDPEGPPVPPELSLDVDVAETVELHHGGRGARVDLEIACRPGQHVVVELQLFQDQGENDVVGAAGADVERCHGTTPVSIDVPATGGGRFQPGAGVAVAFGVGFRGAGDDAVVDTEFADVRFVG